jgi:hypothetical protein
MSGSRQRPSSSPWPIVVLTTAFGVVAALAAAGGVGPFSGLRQHPVQHLVSGQLRGAPLDALSLFTPPPRAVVTKNVDVYDPPPVSAYRASLPTATPPPGSPRPTPIPTTSEPGDGGSDG